MRGKFVANFKMKRNGTLLLKCINSTQLCHASGKLWKLVKGVPVLVHPLIATRRLKKRNGSDPSLGYITVCLLNGN